MHHTHSTPFFLTLAALAAFTAPQVFAQDAPPVAATDEFEEPPTLDAATILRPEYAEGPHFRVRPEVPTYAGQNQYLVASDFGVFDASGNVELVERIQEIAAIAKLKEVSRTDEYTAALKKAAESPLLLAKGLVKQPVKTISGVPKGIWKLLNRAGQSVKEIGEKREHNPYEGKTGEDLIGFTDAKRKLALKLHVDPYSTNETFQRELNGIAWASYAGSMTFSLALAPVGGSAGTAITGINMADSAQEALLDSDPTDQRRLSLGKLLAMDVPREDAVAFLNGKAFSPTEQTLFVVALARLDGVRGRTDFVRMATESTDHTDAVFFRRTVQIMAKVDQETPLAGIRIVQGLPVCVAKDGTAIVAVEWDYVTRTKAAASFLQALKEMDGADSKITGYRLVVSGVASPVVKERLAAQGIGLTEKALPGPLQ